MRPANSQRRIPLPLCATTGVLAVPKSGKRKATKHLTPEEIPLIPFHLSNRDRLIVRMFLVLGLRPGEMFALRWNDKQGNSLRIDSSITDGMEVETKTEGSDSFVWLPASIDTELEFWRGTATNANSDAFIFPSSRGTAINTNNFLFRVLKEAGLRCIPTVANLRDLPQLPKSAHKCRVLS